MSNEDNYNAIRGLCEEYYQQRITKDEYRKKRSILLNKIENEVNYESTGDADDSATGFVNKLVTLFKNKDEEKLT